MSFVYKRPKPSMKHQSQVYAPHKTNQKLSKMFKLVVLFAVVAVAAAKPGFLGTPSLAVAPAIETRTAIIGEKTIESHGNSIVHASAPVVSTYAAAAPVVSTYAAAAPVVSTYAAAAPVVSTYAAAAPIIAAPAVRTSIIGERTIEAHGNTVVHGSAPIITSYSSPVYSAYAAAHAAPLLYGAPAYGKTIYGGGLLL